MRKLLVLASFAAAAGSLGWAARAEEPAKPAVQPAPLPAPLPDLGAGPHRDFREMEGGNGDSLRPGQPEPKVPLPSGIEKSGPSGKDGASAGSSAQPKDESKEDERRATESKEKAKKRPGYKDEAPSPRG